MLKVTFVPESIVESIETSPPKASARRFMFRRPLPPKPFAPPIVTASASKPRPLSATSIESALFASSMPTFACVAPEYFARLLIVSLKIR